MKQQTMAALLAILSFSSVGFGGSLVCAGRNLYSSYVQRDFGTPPLPGTNIGKNVISYNGQILVNQDLFTRPHEILRLAEYQVVLIGDAKTLEETGERAYGSKIFKQTAVLLKRVPDSLVPEDQQGQEVAREQVVCEQTWAFVP